MSFAAVPTWGTDSVDLRCLESCPNVTVLEAVQNIDALLSQSSILLAPSRWAEAFGRIVVEAMLGEYPRSQVIPAFPEAKLGVDYVLPVNLIVS